MLITALVLAAATPPPAAVAEATAVVEAKSTEEAKPEPFPLSGSVSITNSLGSGTFNTSPPNPTFSTALTLAPSAKLIGDWTGSLRQIFALEWTDSDGTTTARQMEMSDLTAGVRYGGFKWADLNLSTSLGASVDLPLSMASRQIGRLGAFRGAGGATWTDNNLGLSVGGTATLGYSLLVPGLGQRIADSEIRPLDERTLGGVTPVGCNLRSSAELQSYACLDGGLPSVFSWAASLNVSYAQLLEGKLTLAASLGYAQAFSAYFSPDDEFTSNNAVAGWVPRQRTTGDLSASYAATDWLVLTGGASSSQGLLTADGKGVRFPFWDFVSPYSNFSSLYVDAALSF